MGRQIKARSVRNGQEMCKKGQAGLMYKLSQGENGTGGDHGGSLLSGGSRTVKEQS